MAMIYIVVGNIAEQILNITSEHMIILTFKHIIVPTAVWTILGMCIGTFSWKINEKAYDNYVKQHNIE